MWTARGRWWLTAGSQVRQAQHRPDLGMDHCPQEGNRRHCGIQRANFKILSIAGHSHSASLSEGNYACYITRMRPIPNLFVLKRVVPINLENHLFSARNPACSMVVRTQSNNKSSSNNTQPYQPHCSHMPIRTCTYILYVYIHIYIYVWYPLQDYPLKRLHQLLNKVKCHCPIAGETSIKLPNMMVKSGRRRNNWKDWNKQYLISLEMLNKCSANKKARIRSMHHEPSQNKPRKSS